MRPFGTDYPYFPSEQFDRMFGFLDDLDLSAEREAAIYNENQRVIGIE